MNDSMAQMLLYAHLTSLALWMGGLFGYLVIVWPAIIGDAGGRFPRALLAAIAMRTAPWIYAAMLLALGSFAALWLTGSTAAGRWPVTVYGILLLALIGNNVYGSVVAWPRMMLLPFEVAGREWFWFRVRMGAALAIGLALYCAGIYYDFNRS